MIYITGKAEKNVDYIQAFTEAYLRIFDIFGILGQVVKAPFHTNSTDLSKTIKLFNTIYTNQENVIIKLIPKEKTETMCVNYIEQDGYTLLIVHTLPYQQSAWLSKALVELMYSFNYLLQINTKDFCADSYNAMYYKKQAMIQKSRNLTEVF